MFFSLNCDIDFSVVSVLTETECGCDSLRCRAKALYGEKRSWMQSGWWERAESGEMWSKRESDRWRKKKNLD